VHREVTQFTVAVTNHSALSSDKMSDTNALFETNLFEKRVAPFGEGLLLNVHPLLLQYLDALLLILGSAVLDLQTILFW